DVLARVWGAALLGAALDRVVGDLLGVGSVDAAERLGVVEVAGHAEVAIDDEPRPLAHEPARLGAVELVPPALAGPRGNRVEQPADQLPDVMPHIIEKQVRLDQPHSAVDVVAHAARRADAPLARARPAPPA